MTVQTDADDPFAIDFDPEAVGGDDGLLHTRILRYLDQDIPDDVKKQLAIKVEDIDGEMVRQSGKYARWAMYAAEAQGHAERAKRDLELVEARLDKVVRERFISRDEKTTEDKVAKEIRRDDDYIFASNQMLRTKETANILAALARAFDMRAQMLIQIGANQRRAEAQFR